MPTRRASSAKTDTATATALDAPAGIDLDNYVPAYLTWIANKLSRGASQYYLANFDVGIEIWRCLVLLATQEQVSAQQVSKVIGLDKGAVSRCFKEMQSRGFITMGLDANDGRLRMARLTPRGRRLHDQMMGMALAREQALLSVLSAEERKTLVGLLRRLHENLPEVEVATERYLQEHAPAAKKRTRSAAAGDSANA
ncbi:MarR family winged helix-turn-helix transcriptional regulator [Azohydromonas australica]|uniref:MarR family winged helix-turn-helix transcriptional regulator n=1 Tax=Azohydromonas australica TaxID=364039 RepID=UPI0006862643|nr:MarR family winged helix-turn-helix transcriptional regulator [Azohydromonas australica]